MIDSHVHLNSPQMIKEVETYIKNAQAVGVNQMIVVGYDIQTSKKAIELAEKYECAYAVVGIHPCDSIDLKDTDFDEIERLLQHPKVVALGEIGLDYHWDTVSKEDQAISFKRQLRIARKHQKPVVIHCREAMEDTFNTIVEEDIHQGVFHCYSGSLEMAERIIKQGFYISLGGPVTFKNSKTPKEVAKLIDINRLLVETDSPYLAPQAKRGQQNEPAYVYYVIEEIAKLRNEQFSYIDEITTNNTKALFKIK